jgi:hypothetical protein
MWNCPWHSPWCLPLVVSEPASCTAPSSPHATISPSRLMQRMQESRLTYKTFSLAEPGCKKAVCTLRGMPATCRCPQPAGLHMTVRLSNPLHHCETAGLEAAGVPRMNRHLYETDGAVMAALSQAPSALCSITHPRTVCCSAGED